MKKVFIASVFFIAFGFSGFAQDWFTNFDKAKQEASQSHHNIILVFQGSDWCTPCIKLDKEIWSTAEFQELAKDHFVMMQADFPRKKANKLPEDIAEQNGMLAEKYNQQGYFPFVVVLNPEGKVLGNAGYEKMSPTEYYNKLTSFEK